MQIVWVAIWLDVQESYGLGVEAILEASWTETWRSGTACHAVSERTVYD